MAWLRCWRLSPCLGWASSTPGSEGRWNGSDTSAPARHPDLSRRVAGRGDGGRSPGPGKQHPHDDGGSSGLMGPAEFGLACCAIEMIATAQARFDIARFGSEAFRASPRQADLMIVSGRVSQKMAPVVKHIYEQMLDPKWVIAMGDCASCGGVFNNYALVQGVDKLIPVDVYVAGCPPRPEALLYGFLKLQELITKPSRRRR